MRVYTIWGVAGAGKTTYLAQLLNGETKLDGFNFEPQNTICLSFSRMARSALQSKLKKDYTVNTFHSFISQLLKQAGMLRIAKAKDINQFFKERGFVGELNNADITAEYNMADHIYSDFCKIRLLDITPEEYYYGDYERSEVARQLTESEFVELYQEFLKFLDKAGSDYTDILIKGLDLRPDIKNLVIDEANDLSPLMWKLVQTWKPEKVLLVGDPNQNVFEFAGSKPDFLLLEKPIHELVVSHRVPQKILQHAISYLVFPFSKMPYSVKSGGLVLYTYFEGFLSKELPTMPNDITIYILTYRRKTARLFSSILVERDIPHLLFDEPVYPVFAKRLYYLYHASENLTVDDLRLLLQDSNLSGKTALIKTLPKKATVRAVDFFATYHLIKKLQNLSPQVFTKDERKLEWFFRIQRNPKWLKPQPRINVSTIHQVKGGEADVVFLHFDIHWYLDTNYIKRLYYVGCTRAKAVLYLDWETAGKI